jgi:two-component system chemotaxis response regulator CheB
VVQWTCFEGGDVNKIRILVVDDSALVRSLLKEIINRQADMECIGTACDPLVARGMIRELNPDVVTLDVEMPRMDGLDFLERLMRLRPTPVVMVSTLTERGAAVTMRALELGAVDFLPKPRFDLAGGMNLLATQFVEKLRIASKAHIKRRVIALPEGAGSAKVGEPPLRASASGFSPACVVFIGASTGGTEAIREILVRLPEAFPPVLITQHMPPGFTASFAARLHDLCALSVKEAADGDRILSGHVYIAPGGYHLRVRRGAQGLVASVEEGEPVNRHRPSVEVLFRSAAALVGANAIGVMLTGMGDDGAAAMREMRDAGSYNFVQDEASCVVFGMPREAILHDAADEVLPLGEIASALIRKTARTR